MKYLKAEVFKDRRGQKRLIFYFCDWKGHKEKDGRKHSLNLLYLDLNSFYFLSRDVKRKAFL